MKTKHILPAAVAAFVFPFSALAEKETVDGIEWTYFISWGRAHLGNLYSNTVSTSTSGAIRIPDMLGGYPVTEIQPRAFRGCNKITSISIPDSVKVIYASAFEGCSSNLFDRTTMPGALLVDGWLVGFAEVPPPHGTVLLDMNDQCFRGIGSGWWDDSSTWPVSVIVKDGTENLDGTFREWGTLVSVTLPDSVRNIGFAAFEGCTSLVEVAMSQCVTNIADSAFRRCTALESLDLPDTVVSLGWDAFSECESLRELSIPNVRSIPEGAFMMCRSLERIDFSPAITNIGWDAFAECESLRTMPDLHGLSAIAPYSFHRCASLTEAIIPNSVTNIGERAFSCCSITSIVVHAGVTNIDDCAFMDCWRLERATLTDGLQRIGQQAFQGCARLSAITIPDGITEISVGAFGGCSSLTEVTIPDSVTSINGWTFDGCNHLESVTLGNGVTNIDVLAFWGCSRLGEIRIPDSMESIANSAFRDCVSLTAISCPEHLSGRLDRLEIPSGCQIQYRNVRLATKTEGAYVWFHNADDAPWRYVDDTTAADGACARSGLIPTNGTSTAVASLNGYGGILSFRWKVSAGVGDCARFYIGKELVREIIQANEWREETVRIPSDSTGHTVRWCFEHGGHSAEGENAAFLDDVSWRPLVYLSVKSDHGTASPKARYNGWNHPYYYGDEVPASVEASAEEDGIRYVCTGWTGSGNVPPSGTGTNVSFTIKEYSTLTWNWEAVSCSIDGTSVPLSFLDENAADILLAHGRDYEAAANAAAANGVNKVWECYVAGIDPTDEEARFEATIEIGADGKPEVKWNPDLNENGAKAERIYTVEGKAELQDAWGPTNNSSRFFHVKVGMPE